MRQLYSFVSGGELLRRRFTESVFSLVPVTAWQVTLCDPIWLVILGSCEMAGVPLTAIQDLYILDYVYI